jgi:hypothetical protein
MKLRLCALTTSVVSVAIVLTLPLVHALESRADLGVTLRLIGTSPVHAGTTAGTARIEVAVDAFRATEILSVDVLGAGGEPWAAQKSRVIASDQVWTDATGRTIDATAKELIVGARGLLKTRIEVPLDGAAVHEVVVRVVGRSGDRVLQAEDALRIPFGVPPVVDDDGTFANVPVQEVP